MYQHMSLTVRKTSFFQHAVDSRDHDCLMAWNQFTFTTYACLEVDFPTCLQAGADCR